MSYRNEHRSVLHAFRLAFLFLLLSACTADDRSGEGRERSVKLMLSWSPGAEHAFIYRAIDKGYFRENGIRVEVLPSRGSSEVASALDSKAIEFGLISGDYVVIARHQGVPIKALMAIYPESPATIFSIDSIELSKPQDLIGKRVGVLQQSSTYPQYISMLRTAGIDTTAIRHIPAVRGGVTQLVSGDIDALMHYTNYAPVALRTQGHRVSELLMKDYGVDIYSTTLATTDRVISDDPELVRDFVRIMYRALIESEADASGALRSLLRHEPALDSLQERAGIQRTNELVFVRNQERQPGTMTAAGWDRTQQTVLRAGQIPTIIDVQFFYNGSFLEHAMSLNKNREPSQ